nr:ATP-binding cassette domain-containing protein [Geotalea toluenoxydans]
MEREDDSPVEHHKTARFTLLFRDASFQILPGSRTGLVGPNGAGKTSIFRIITGEEEVDAGEITLAKNTTIGYFSQDVGDMAGRSALAEVMAGAGDTVQLAAELKKMEEAMCLPMADDEMADLLERYGAAWRNSSTRVAMIWILAPRRC